jgi:DNA-binding response OmpR family regulator
MPGARILIIEDDEVIRSLLQRNLQARSHQVFLARNAQMALDFLRAMPFDLIILDINLPDQTGWEILRVACKEGIVHPCVHDNGQTKLPVAVCSAVRVTLARQQEFPLLAYLPKPFPISALLRLAEECVGTAQKTVKN